MDEYTPGTGTPDEQIGSGLTRHDVASWTRRDVMEVAAVLLGQVHDIDFHHYSDGAADWLYDLPTEAAAEMFLDLTDRLTSAAQAAATAVRASLARREWLLTGRPLRCLACDESIDPTLDEWLVCRGHAEHTVCHLDDVAAEDADRTFTLTEAERAAYLEDRNRAGQPHHNDLVEVTYPDGRTVEAIWQITPDGRATARTDEYRGAPIDMGDVVRIEVLDLAEDAGISPPDGSPVDDEWVRNGATCAGCHLPLDQTPAVWDAGYVVHQQCLTPTDQPGSSR